MASFEDIRQRIDAVDLPKASDQRAPVWFASGNAIGVARDLGGRFEVFLAADGIVVSSSVIKRHLVEDRWRRSNGEEFFAARILIPGDPHFVGVAALIVSELLRNGFAIDPRTAFTLSESLIEIALERSGISDSAVLGLLGELIVLEQAIVLHPEPGMRQRALDLWTGYQRASRDFTGVRASIEVKATTRNRSRHQISNLDQVTPNEGPGGSTSTGLYLISIGLVPSESAGRSVSSQVETICGLLERGLASDDAARLRGAFLQCLRCYGVQPGQLGGYDHEVMRSWMLFSARWETVFLRVYDMCDVLVRVPRRSDFAPFRHLVDGSVEFDIDLPDVVRGDINPQTDSAAALRHLFAR
jgi:hypothetical protein